MEQESNDWNRCHNGRVAGSEGCLIGARGGKPVVVSGVSPTEPSALSERERGYERGAVEEWRGAGGSELASTPGREHSRFCADNDHGSLRAQQPAILRGHSNLGDGRICSLARRLVEDCGHNDR